jgi:hypothetical protein
MFSMHINNEIGYDRDKITRYILDYYKNLLGTINDRIFTLNNHLWNDNKKNILEISTKLEDNFTIEEIKGNF